MMSTWERKTRVGIGQANAAMISPIDTTPISPTTEATTTRTARPGMVMAVSASVESTVSTFPRMYPAENPRMMPVSVSEARPDQADLERTGRADGEHRQHVAPATVGSQRVVRGRLHEPGRKIRCGAERWNHTRRSTSHRDLIGVDEDGESPFGHDDEEHQYEPGDQSRVDPVRPRSGPPRGCSLLRARTCQSESEL